MKRDRYLIWMLGCGLCLMGCDRQSEDDSTKVKGSAQQEQTLGSKEEASNPAVAEKPKAVLNQPKDLFANPTFEMGPGPMDQFA